jgi:aminoglycoside phosphotransferase family enzyme/predicted kinase
MQGESAQVDVIDLLANPATHGGAQVERIDTHASIVFLAGPRAFKLKRAVRYDYLDFSTPELRKRYCDAEFAINRRTAPGLYRSVVPIVRTPSGLLELGGEGTPVDWALEMARFDQGALLDRMAVTGRLPLALMAPLAEEIASFHQHCASRDDFGGEPGIARVIRGNAAGLRESGSAAFGQDPCDALTRAALRALRSAAPLLESRREAGFVRACHGDLHLGNIVLLDGRPTLFDAIEFNDDLACVDVMYDLAFLLMDLWHRRLPSHASAVFNAYLAVTNDLDALAALPLFLSCRAAIRAKTTATAARLRTSTITARTMAAEARDYLVLATRALNPGPPRMVAIGGLSGSGKTTLARALAPVVGAIPGAVILRSDEIRKRLWGTSPLTKLGPEAYSPEMSERVYEVLAGDALAVLETGHSVVVDAVFASAPQRAAIERAARLAGAAFAPVWLDAPEEVLIRRVSRREADVSDADEHVVRMQYAQWSGDVRWPRVDAAADPATVHSRANACLRTQSVALGAAA